MKIIHIAWALEGYGIGTFLLNLIPYQNRGFKNLIADILFESNNPVDKERYKELDCKYYCLGLKTAENIGNISKMYDFYKIIKNAVDILGDSEVIVSSVEKLSDAIEKLERDIELRNRIIKSVQERARLFDVSYTAKNLYKIYLKLLKNGKKYFFLLKAFSMIDVHAHNFS